MGDWIVVGGLYLVQMVTLVVVLALAFRRQCGPLSSGGNVSPSQDVSLSATKPLKPKREPPIFEPDFQKVGALKHYEEQIQTAASGIAFNSDGPDDGLDKDYWINWLTRMAKKRREVLDSIDEDEKLFKAVSRIVKQS